MLICCHREGRSGKGGDFDRLSWLRCDDFEHTWYRVGFWTMYKGDKSLLTKECSGENFI